MKSKKGFTLVELLIVIVVIGILSAIMMLSSTEAVSSAKAARIINNLRNFKTGFLACYADNLDKFSSDGHVMKKDGSGWTNISQADSCIQATDIAKYVSGEFKAVAIGSQYSNNGVQDTSGVMYSIREIYTEGKNTWYIVCKYAADDKDMRLREKLEARANTIGLLDNSNPPVPYTATGSNRHILHVKVAEFSR